MYLNCGGNSGGINQTFIIEPLNSTVVSACTTIFTNLIETCSGNTNILLGTDTIILSGNVQTNGDFSGNSFFGNSIISNAVSATTYYSGGTNLIDIINGNDTFITGATYSGSTLILNRNDNVPISATFTGNTSGDCLSDLFVENIHGCSPIILHDDINPISNNTINLGTSLIRFREINTVSGTSTYWTLTNTLNTPMIDLGLDLSGNTRQITAENSIIQDDFLIGGGY